MWKVLLAKENVSLNMLISAFLATFVCSIFIIKTDYLLGKGDIWLSLVFGFLFYALPNVVLWWAIFCNLKDKINVLRKRYFLSAIIAGIVCCLVMSVGRLSLAFELYMIIGPASVVSALIVCVICPPGRLKYLLFLSFGMLLSSLPVMSLMALVLNRVFLHHYVLYSSLMIWIFKSKTAFLIMLIIYNAIWVLSTLYLQKKFHIKSSYAFSAR